MVLNARWRAYDVYLSSSMLCEPFEPVLVDPVEPNTSDRIAQSLLRAIFLSIITEAPHAVKKLRA